MSAGPRTVRGEGRAELDDLVGVRRLPGPPRETPYCAASAEDRSVVSGVAAVVDRSTAPASRPLDEGASTSVGPVDDAQANLTLGQGRLIDRGAQPPPRP